MNRSAGDFPASVEASCPAVRYRNQPKEKSCSDARFERERHRSAACRPALLRQTSNVLLGSAPRRAAALIIACLYDCAYNLLPRIATGTVRHGTKFRGAAQGIPGSAAKDLS